MTELTPAGRRILDAASGLFYRQGIHAVGVEGIARAADVTKKTLYDCFGSKDELVAAYLRTRDARWRAFLTDHVERCAESSADRLPAVFDALAAWMRRENPRGCVFVNALAELPDAGHPGRAVITAQKTWLLGYLTELAEQAGADDPATLAATLFLLHEGATVAHGSGVLADAADHARRLTVRLTGAREAG